MKKYITLENNIYEATLILSTDKTNDEFVPVNRKNGIGGDKNHFFVSTNLFEDFGQFFPLILKDKRENMSNRNKITIKNFFSISNILNDLDFINNEITNNYKKEVKIKNDDFSESIFSIAKKQNLKTNFFIESELSSAGNGIGFKNWNNSYSSTIKLLLLHSTKTKVYLFKKEGEVCSYFEFIQEYSAQKTDSFLEQINKTLIQKIYYGAPGTGKSHKVNDILKGKEGFYERVTFHPEFDNSSFVGGYRPVSETFEQKTAGGEMVVKDEVKYKFVPQAFTNIYTQAWNDLDNQYYLAIEEINRGNCAEIFGDIFQLLDRKSNYSVSPSNELKEHLNIVLNNKGGIKNGLKLPSNLSILATMNTSDQSLFPMDSAFKRRWDWEYIPICYKEKTEEEERENESFFYKVYLDETKTKYFKWIDFIEKINFVIEDNENLGMDKCIGNYFIKSDTKEITLKEFVNKAIFYLWNDVFKDEDSSKSIFEKGVTFEKFFPIKSNGKNLLEKILINNNIDILPKEI